MILAPKQEVELMAALTSDAIPTVAPSKADTALALESTRQLATQKLGRKTSVRMQLVAEGEDNEAVDVPASAFRLFVRMLTEMSQGNSITLIPTHAELTTQQAADLLNVSRPYVVKLLDEGKMPSRTVGKFRRVRFDDLMEYKQKDDEYRRKVLDQLTAEAQELGMGY
jgi:excisionase family DNA binding protein